MKKSTGLMILYLILVSFAWGQVPNLAQAIGVLGAVGTLVVLYHAFRCWTNKKVRIWGKLQATLFVLVCFGFLWFAFVGNLLRFSSSF